MLSGIGHYQGCLNLTRVDRKARVFVAFLSKTNRGRWCMNIPLAGRGIGGHFAQEQDEWFVSSLVDVAIRSIVFAFGANMFHKVYRISSTHFEKLCSNRIESRDCLAWYLNKTISWTLHKTSLYLLVLSVYRGYREVQEMQRGM